MMKYGKLQTTVTEKATFSLLLYSDRSSKVGELCALPDGEDLQ